MYPRVDVTFLPSRDQPPRLLTTTGNIRLGRSNVGPPSTFGIDNLPSIDREAPILPNEKEIVGPIVPAQELRRSHLVMLARPGMGLGLTGCYIGLGLLDSCWAEPLNSFLLEMR